MSTNSEQDTNVTESSISFFKRDLDEPSKMIHEKALARAKKYLAAEADLLDSLIEVDRSDTYQKFGYDYLTHYCEKELGLSEPVAATFVRVARKSQAVPELQEAVREERISVNTAKTIASVITKENQEEWIAKAENLSKRKLEEEIAAASPKTPRPEKAKPVAEDRVRVEFELSKAEMEKFQRAQDLLSAKLGRRATLAETFAWMQEAALEKHDPVRKAERAVRRAAAKAEPAPAQKEKPTARPATPLTGFTFTTKFHAPKLARTRPTI